MCLSVAGPSWQNPKRSFPLFVYLPTRMWMSVPCCCSPLGLVIGACHLCVGHAPRRAEIRPPPRCRVPNTTHGIPNFAGSDGRALCPKSKQAPLLEDAALLASPCCRRAPPSPHQTGPMRRITALEATRADRIALLGPRPQVAGAASKQDTVHPWPSQEVRVRRPHCAQRGLLHLLGRPEGDLLLRRERLRQDRVL